MWYDRMTLEVWFDAHQYEVDVDLGESAVKYHTVGELGIDLSDVALRYGHHRGLPALREAIVDQYPGLGIDDVVVTTGASEANFAVVSALLEPGAHAIVEQCADYPGFVLGLRSLRWPCTRQEPPASSGLPPHLHDRKGARRIAAR